VGMALTAVAGGVDVDVEHEPVGTQSPEGRRGRQAVEGTATEPVRTTAGAVGVAAVADQIEKGPRERIVSSHHAELVARRQLGDRSSTGLPRSEQHDADIAIAPSLAYELRAGHRAHR